MNLRELFNKTMRDAETTKVDTQLVKVSSQLSAFAASLPELLGAQMKKAAAGQALSDSDWAMRRLKIELPGIYARQVTQAALEKCPGYKDLVSICKSRKIDMGIDIWIENGGDAFKGTNRAVVTFSIMPEKPFSSRKLKPHYETMCGGGRTIQ